MWIYAVQVALIVMVLVVVVAMIPMRMVELDQTSQTVENIKYMPVHLYIKAGRLLSVNGTPASELVGSGAVFGLPEVGELVLEVMPGFAQTMYKEEVPLRIEFTAAAGRSYEVGCVRKKPRLSDSLLSFAAIPKNETLLGCPLYIVVRDITNARQARVMRTE